MYADDYQMYETGTNLHSVTTKLNESSTLATDWYDSNEQYQTTNICRKGVM